LIASPQIHKIKGGYFMEELYEPYIRKYDFFIYEDELFHNVDLDFEEYIEED